jgi:hypothetical protein
LPQKTELTEEETLQLHLLVAAHQAARRRARIIGAVAAGLAASFFAALIFFDGDDQEAKPGRVQGRLELLNTPVGSRNLLFSDLDCRSGYPEQFRGVDFTSQDGLAVRIHEDNMKGSSVRLMADGQQLVLRRSDCRVLELELSDFEGRTKKGRAYRGALELDCQLGAARVSGSLSFEDCYD